MNYLLEALKWLKARLKEPSTYAGLATILTLFGVNANDPDTKNMIDQVFSTIDKFVGAGDEIGAFLAGLAAIVLKDKGGTTG